MLCFLPPIPQDGPPSSPATSGKIPALLVLAIVLCALLLPFGWTPASHPLMAGGHGASALRTQMAH